MGNPTIFPNGIGTYPGGNTLSSFPSLPGRFQAIRIEDFIPYRSADYTATTGGTGAAIAAFAWNSGAVRLTSGSTTPFKAVLAHGSNFVQCIPGNGIWYEMRAAMPTGSMTNPSNDADFYSGFCDNADPTAAANGIYFYKPSGGTAIHFIIRKASVTTTFQNIGDFAKPSGAYGDALDVAGTLTANATGTTLSSLTVGTPGFGYKVAPLLLINGTAGTGATAYVQTGGAAGYPTVSGRYPGSSLYAPIVTGAGSGYTAGTFTADVIPWVNMQMFFDGKGRLQVGIGGRIVLTLDKYAQTKITPGDTVNTATGAKAYNFKDTTLSAGIMPVQPAPGDPIVALPLVLMQPAFGIVGTTANNRVAYVDEMNVAVELN
jgi:hypothetical protein